MASTRTRFLLLAVLVMRVLVDESVDVAGTSRGLYAKVVGKNTFSRTCAPDTLVRRFPQGTTRTCTAFVTLTSNEPKWAYEVQLDDDSEWRLAPQFTSINDPSTTQTTAEQKQPPQKIGGLVGRQVLHHPLRNLSTGLHRLRIRTIDAQGVRDPSPFLAEWVVAQPTLAFVKALPERLEPYSDHWVEVKSDAAKFEIQFRIDSGPWQGMVQYGNAHLLGHSSRPSKGVASSSDDLRYTESPRTVQQRIRATTEGPHTLYLRALDECGNHGEVVSASWVTSWVTTKIVQSLPSGDVQDTTATFSANADSHHYFLEYSHNGGEWLRSKKLKQATVAHTTLYDLAEGIHEVRVRALDASGRPDHQPQVYTWIVDHTPPKTIIEEGFPRVEGTSVMVDFRVEDEGTSTASKYQLGDGEWRQLHGNHVELTRLADGVHVLRIRSVDAAGNEELNPALVTFSIDASPPTTSMAQGPDRYSSDHNARFWLRVSEKGSQLMYSLDNSAFLPTESLLEIKDLDDGQHVLRVYCIDEAGNREPDPFTYTWNIDTAAPHTAIHAGWGTPQRPRFAVSALPGEGEQWESFVYNFEYCVDGSEWLQGEKSVRLGPGYEVTLEGLSPGEHTLMARASDLAGNVDPRPTTHTFVVPEPTPAWKLEWMAEGNQLPNDSAAVPETQATEMDAWEEQYEEESRGWFAFLSPRRGSGSRSKILGLGELRRRQ